MYKRQRLRFVYRSFQFFGIHTRAVAVSCPRRRKGSFQTALVHAKILVDYVKLLCDDMDKGGLETALSAARAAYGDGSGVYAEELKAAIDEAQTVYEDEHAAVTDKMCIRDSARPLDNQDL